MIHAIYRQSKPKAKWCLVSLAVSAEAASHDLKEAREQVALEGNEQAKVAVKCFETAFHIPQFLDEVIDQKPVFN